MKQNASKPRKFLDNEQTTKLDYFGFEKLNGLAFGITYIETDTMGRNFAGYAPMTQPQKSTE
jgi:hypothetical protein